MAFIDTVADNDAEGELVDLYQQARDPGTGRLDNIMAIHSLHSAGLAAHLQLYSAVMAGTASLRKVDREMIALVAASAFPSRIGLSCMDRHN